MSKTSFPDPVIPGCTGPLLDKYVTQLQESYAECDHKGRLDDEFFGAYAEELEIPFEKTWADFNFRTADGQPWRVIGFFASCGEYEVLFPRYGEKLQDGRVPLLYFRGKRKPSPKEIDAVAWNLAHLFDSEEHALHRRLMGLEDPPE